MYRQVTTINWSIIQCSVTEIRYQLLYMNMYHSVEVNDVDIIHTSLVYILPSKQHCSPVIYCSEGKGRTWRRSLSSGSRTAPHTCSKSYNIHTISTGFSHKCTGLTACLDSCMATHSMYMCTCRGFLAELCTACSVCSPWLIAWLMENDHSIHIQRCLHKRTCMYIMYFIRCTAACCERYSIGIVYYTQWPLMHTPSFRW